MTGSPIVNGSWNVILKFCAVIVVAPLRNGLSGSMATSVSCPSFHIRSVERLLLCPLNDHTSAVSVFVRI